MTSQLLPFTENGRLVGARLANFGLGSAEPLHAHLSWLTMYLAMRMRENPNAWIDLIGYATGPGKDQVAWARIKRVESVLRNLHSQLRVNVRMVGAIEGQVDERGQSIAPGMAGYWNAVLIRWYGVDLKVEPVVAAEQAKGPGSTKWSVAGLIGLQNNPISLSSESVWKIVPAQVSINMYRFRNDETGQIGTFISPLSGAGFSFDATLLLKEAETVTKGFVEGLSMEMKASWLLVEKALRKNSKPNFLRELAKVFATGAQSGIWSSYSSAQVQMPVSMAMLNGATMGNLSLTIPNQAQMSAMWVYGQAHYTDKNGKKSYGVRDFLKLPWDLGAQFSMPSVGAGFIGGPLIAL